MKKILNHPFLLSILVILLLILSNHQGWLRGPQDIFLKITVPIQRLVYQCALEVNKFFGFFTTLQSLNQQNTALKQERVALLAKIAQLEEIAQENELIRKQLGFVSTHPQELILADVIGQEVNVFEKYIFIDKGLKNGVDKGAAVIAAGNILVGQIIETESDFARVQLIGSSRFKINAQLQQSKAKGLVRGEDGRLVIDLLPQDTILQKDELVLTSGLAGLFPSGLLIGQIEEVLSFDVQVAQTAKVKPVIEFEDLTKVFVLKNNFSKIQAVSR